MQEPEVGLSLIYGKKKDQSALQLTGIQEAGLEGFEPPTHGLGNRFGVWNALQKGLFQAPYGSIL